MSFLFPRSRPQATLQRYVVRELIFPTTLALCGFTALILTKDLLGFSDLIINRGFGVATVALIAFYELIPLLTRTLPFAVLMGTLVGLGRLKADRELLAVEAAGVSSRWLVSPILTFTTATTIAGLFLSLSASPWAARSLTASLQQMVLANPGLSLRPGTVHQFGDVRMSAREISPRGNQLRGVLLWVPHLGQTIFAESGELAPVGDGSARLTLYTVEMLLSPQGGGGEMRFETSSMSLRDTALQLRRNEDPLAGVGVSGLMERAGVNQENGDLARQARMELHRRFSYPTASVVFGLLAVAFTLVSRRASRAAGGSAGFLITVGYYGLVELGNGLAQAGVVNAGLGVWLPNLMIGALALALLWREPWRLASSRHLSRPDPVKQHARRSEAHFPRFQRYLLQRYVVRQYLQMLGLAFALLLVGYVLVDVLERLQWFARYHAETLEVLRFYGARLPQLVVRVIPTALLLATALTVSVLSAHHELTAMRACGVTVARVLLPMVLIAGVVAPGYFLLNEFVVPRTNALEDQLKDTEIRDRGPRTGLLHTMIWYRAGTHVYQAMELDPQLGEAQEISIYELDANGLPVSRTDAQAAKHLGNGLWELVDPVRIEISAQGLRKIPADRQAQLGEVPSTTVDITHLNTRQLARQIRNAEASGYNATVYQVDFHVKLAAPLACVLLPAVALFFAIGGPPFPGPALTLLVSAGLSIGYILLISVCASLGYGGFLPPSLAGWGPPASLAASTGALAFRSRL